MRFRKFNDRGLQAFSAYLDALRANPASPIPERLLEDSALTEPLDPPIDADPQTFNTRMDFVCWLHDAAGAADSEIPTRDAGFWAWMSLVLFNQVCPLRNGKRKPGQTARHIPMFDDWRRRYRHLLATPYNAFLWHEDNPMRVALILNPPLHTLGDITENIAGRQDLIGCPGTMALINRLFFDETNNQKKYGASGDAANRLGKLLNQYQRTWDITIMSPEQSIELMPKEFDRFKE